MSGKTLQALAMNVAVVVAGVLIAGAVMSKFRGQVDAIAVSHAGFDS